VDNILIREIHTPEEKASALKENDGVITIFSANGGLYITTQLSEDFSVLIPGCEKIGKTVYSNYFLDCSKEDLPEILRKFLGMQASWAKN
jgi:hypothetical protein